MNTFTLLFTIGIPLEKKVKKELKTIKKPAVSSKIMPISSKNNYKDNDNKTDNKSSSQHENEGQAESHVSSFDGQKAFEHFQKGNPDPEIESKFEVLEQQKERTIKEKGLTNSTFKDRLKSAGRNIGNIAKNAFDNTAGYVIAQGQNYQTTRALKKDSKQDVAYVVHGLAQNIGSGWRRSKELKKQGFRVYHVGVNHKKELDEQYKSTSKKIDKFHKKAKITDAYKREDGMIGHSSGANHVIYAAQQPDIKKKGIKYVTAVAGTPNGMEMNTPEAKALSKILNIDADDKNTTKGKKTALELNKRRPYISVDSVAGYYDGLVGVKDTAYQYANKQHIINHPDSTHFGTSGSNAYMNKILANILAQQRNQLKKTYITNKKQYMPDFTDQDVKKAD